MRALEEEDEVIARVFENDGIVIEARVCERSS